MAPNGLASWRTRRPPARSRGWRRSMRTRPSWRRSFRASRPARRSARIHRMKKRLDVLLVERGLAESRTQAQALVPPGLVRGFDKPGTQVDEAAELDVERPPRYVSR